MRFRPRIVAMTLALGLAATGLAGCASDSAELSYQPTGTNLYAGYYDDPYYDYDAWPYFWGGFGHRHFGDHAFHGSHFGGHHFGAHHR
jgi:hypothetical protein